MIARISLSLAAALLIAAPIGAGAASLEPSLGPATGQQQLGPATGQQQQGPGAAPATPDPYNQPDMSDADSFSLLATQMLGAAAACEQVHSDRISHWARPGKKKGGAADRADIDAAQQHMLDAAATTPNPLASGDADCDRVSASFDGLQENQFRNPQLRRDLDDPTALPPSDKTPGKTADKKPAR
jgi:crotonobetainyl-CoA:carnitine CoA-transferase CaiB-like acyl-CoA transferase